MSDIRIDDTIAQWKNWSSGSVDELAAIGTAFVWSLGLEPLPETTASTQINRRTIRYYISNGVMDPPDGERRLATYQFRHLLQLLYIKARQHAGDRLSDIRQDLNDCRGESLKSLVLTSLPESVPPPVPVEPGEFARPADLNAVLGRWAYLTGRQGRYRGPLASGDQPNRERREDLAPASAEQSRGTRLRLEIEIDDGVALTVPGDHPLVYDEDGRELILRGIRRLLRDYRNGGGPAGRES